MIQTTANLNTVGVVCVLMDYEKNFSFSRDGIGFSFDASVMWRRAGSG